MRLHLLHEKATDIQQVARPTGEQDTNIVSLKVLLEWVYDWPVVYWLQLIISKQSFRKSVTGKAADDLLWEINVLDRYCCRELSGISLLGTRYLWTGNAPAYVSPVHFPSAFPTEMHRGGNAPLPTMHKSVNKVPQWRNGAQNCNYIWRDWCNFGEKGCLSHEFQRCKEYGDAEAMHFQSDRFTSVVLSISPTAPNSKGTCSLWWALSHP
jgi:hypothetical protein